MQLLDVRYPAASGVQPHAHAIDVVFVVIDGEVHFGRQRYGVRASVLVPALTLYSFTEEPEAVTLLNFRPRRDSSVIRPDELRALQRATKEMNDG